MIVAHHYAIHGGFQLDPSLLTVNKVFYYFLVYAGKIGVNLFVLISGYFLINSNFKVKKAVKLWIEVTFFSVMIYLYFILFKQYPFGLKDLLKSFFPIMYGTYWFATTYFALYLFSNYLNKLIKSISKKALYNLIWILIVLEAFLPTFFMASIASSYLLWFILLYCIAAYIKLYDPILLQKKGYLKSSILLYLLLIATASFIDILGNKIPFLENFPTHFSNLETPTMLLMSILIFVGFKNLNIKSSNIVNTITTCSFGVYLIHDNSIVRHYLWIDLFKNYTHYDSSLFIVYAIFTILLVFILCTLLSGIYYFFIEKIIWFFLDKLWPSLCKNGKNIINFFDKLTLLFFKNI